MVVRKAVISSQTLTNRRIGYQKAPLTGTSTAFSRRDSSMDIASRYDEDEPLEDREEKTGLEQPPEDEHPAYHPLPGQSPGFPSFSPYLPSPVTPTTPTTPVTPIHSNQQKQHPAYHVHQLSQHPAFRSARSPPQPSGTIPKQRSNLQQGVTPPLEGFSFFTKIRNSNVFLRPSSRSRSELPAEVPPIASPPKREGSLLARFNSISSRSSFSPSHRNVKRDNSAKTGLSTYSIPIGLGVDTPTSPGVEPPVTATAFTQPIQKFKTSGLRALTLVENNSASTTPEMPTQEPPRLAANMNEREDHVLSWASYSAGNLSGIGPSNSNGSEKARKQRQREIELGIAPSVKKQRAELQGDVPLGENGTPPMNIEHEIMRWSELRPPQQAGRRDVDPETPLSQVYRESWVEREDWALR
jgi:hypothetical protein